MRDERITHQKLFLKLLLFESTLNLQQSWGLMPVLPLQAHKCVQEREAHPARWVEVGIEADLTPACGAEVH